MPLPSVDSSGNSNLPTFSPGAGGGGGGGAGLSELPEYQQLQTQLQQAHGALAGIQQEFGSYRQARSADDEFLGRLRQALAPQAPAKPSKVTHYNRQLDHYLDKALEHERAGSPIPLTANLAAEFYQTAIEQEQQRLELQAQLAEMQKKLDQALNPDVRIDEQAYTHIDTNVRNALNTIYGPGPQYEQQKIAQFRAVTAQIAAEIRDLKKNDPQAWENIRRLPEKQARMASYFVTQNLPPRARQIIEREQLMAEPMTAGELMEAFHQAGAIEDERERHKTQKLIREQMWELKFSRPGGGGMSAQRGSPVNRTKPNMMSMYQPSRAG